MIDTHAHLNHSDFADDLPATVHRAVEAGLQAILTVGYDLPSSREALALAAAYEELFPTVGLHPHSATEFSTALLRELRHLAAESPVVAIGEVGLDFYRDLSPRPRQREAFRALAGLATELNLPLIIHNREAHEEILEILREETSPELTVIMHCFSGDRDFANECRQQGYYLGIGGSLTYPKSEELRAVVAAYPGKRLLLETDCPWLPPQSRRGRRNEPAWLPEIAEAVAEVRGDSLTHLLAQTTANARSAFHLPVEVSK